MSQSEQKNQPTVVFMPDWLIQIQEDEMFQSCCQLFRKRIIVKKGCMCWNSQHKDEKMSTYVEKKGPAKSECTFSIDIK